MTATTPAVEVQRCAREGCITILSRDTIAHRWDLCAAHREADARAAAERRLAEAAGAPRLLPSWITERRLRALLAWWLDQPARMSMSESRYDESRRSTWPSADELSVRFGEWARARIELTALAREMEASGEI